MIPVLPAPTASISRRRVWVVLWLLQWSGFSGCLAEPEPTLSRLAREREIGAARARHEEQQQELDRLRQEATDAVLAIGAAKADVVRRAAELRAVLADLHRQVSLLQTAEQDLASARARALAIEQELRPLRALEQALVDQETLRVQAGQRVAALEVEVAAAMQAAEQREAELQPRLAALQQQLAAARQIEQALATAEAAVGAAIKTLAPSPPPAEPKKQ